MNLFSKHVILAEFRKAIGVAPYRPTIIHRDVKAGLPQELKHKQQLVTVGDTMYRVNYAEEHINDGDKIFITDPEKLDYVKVIK